MKLLIVQEPLEDTPKDEDKLELSDVKFGKNSKGQWVLRFHTGKHKYPNVELLSSCEPEGEESPHRINGKLAWAYGVSIANLAEEETRDEELDFSYRKTLDKKYIWLVPETEEEELELSNIGVIAPMKYEYYVCIVPWNDMKISELTN